jgi:uncharacterized membrane protein YphA (DoxX/SURF4 family)
MKRFHQGIRRFCAVVIGLVLVASGLLKLLDPVGTSLIVDGYYKFLHIGFLHFSAMAVGVILAFAETLCGLALITGVRRRLVALITGVLLLSFTALTAFLVIFNPEMDCGCFGKAFKLTHAESFIKNIVLCVLAAVTFLPPKDFGTPRKDKRVAFWLSAASIVAAFIFNALRLPAVDFGQFAPGAELMSSQDNPSQYMDEYVASYIYEKDGRRGSFSLNALPDSTWTFVGVDTLKRNSLPRTDSTPVLSIYRDGKDLDTLAATGKVMLISSYAPSRLSARRIRTAGKAAEAAEAAGATVLVLLSEPSEGLPPDLSARAAYSDYKTLVSLNRSNGGFTWLDDGMVLWKWSALRGPSYDELQRISTRDRLDSVINNVSHGRIKFYGFVIYLFAILILV